MHVNTIVKHNKYVSQNVYILTSLSSYRSHGAGDTNAQLTGVSERHFLQQGICPLLPDPHQRTMIVLVKHKGPQETTDFFARDNMVPFEGTWKVLM